MSDGIALQVIVLSLKSFHTRVSAEGEKKFVNDALSTYTADLYTLLGKIITSLDLATGQNGAQDPMYYVLSRLFLESLIYNLSS